MCVLGCSFPLSLSLALAPNPLPALFWPVFAVGGEGDCLVGRLAVIKDPATGICVSRPVTDDGSIVAGPVLCALHPTS